MLVRATAEEKRRFQEQLRKFRVWMEYKPAAGVLKKQDGSKILMQNGNGILN